MRTGDEGEMQVAHVSQGVMAPVLDNVCSYRFILGERPCSGVNITVTLNGANGGVTYMLARQMSNLLHQTS